jgi:hypothetical protein
MLTRAAVCSRHPAAGWILSAGVLECRAILSSTGPMTVDFESFAPTRLHTCPIADLVKGIAECLG